MGHSHCIEWEVQSMLDLTVEIGHECMQLFIAVFKSSHEDRACEVYGDEGKHL